MTGIFILFAFMFLTACGIAISHIEKTHKALEEEADKENTNAKTEANEINKHKAIYPSYPSYPRYPRYPRKSKR